MTAPGTHIIGSGWILGKLHGVDAFTDGCAMFQGPPPAGESCKMKKGLMDRASRNLQLKRPLPTRILREEEQGGHRVVQLSGGVVIQKKYYDFLLKRFPRAELYCGKMVGNSRAVFGIDRGKIVALIMPVHEK